MGEDFADRHVARWRDHWVEASFDDIDSLAGWFGGTELFTRAEPQEKRAAALARVRPEDIREVARRVIRREGLSVTSVGALSPKLARRVKQIVREFR